MIIHKLSNNSYELFKIKNITVIANLLDFSLFINLFFYLESFDSS